MDDTTRLDGMVALITGAGRGIGRAHALHLASLGASVVVNDLGTAPDGAGSDRSPADEVVEAIVAAGGSAVADATDVTDSTAVAAMVGRTIDVFGDLDIVITNAGMLRDRTLVSMTDDEWDAVIHVHLRGTFAPAREAARHWRDRWKAGDRRSRRLITTSSASGIYGNVGQSNYGAAKAGIAAFTVIVAQELDRYGVTVNCLAPSALTRLTEPIVAASGALDDRMRSDLDPAWIARVAGALCSPAAGGITGRVFDVRGREVGVSEGWHLGPVASQPDDIDQIPTVLAELAGSARAHAAMDGRAPAAG
jgi:NAD(P)-dependent dehydrogenase (short-subunit alcohol dehydrogenase family)